MPHNGAGRSGNTIYSRVPDIVPRQIAGDTILVPVRGELARLDRIFVLNPVAEHIWNLLDGSRSVNTVCELVMAEFSVDEDTARTDVEEFLADLEDAGLAAAVSPAP